jgi:hypothetical protein
MQIKVQGSKAIITVDLTQDLGPSQSGKTIIVDKTGPKAVPLGDSGVLLNLSAYKYPEPRNGKAAA